MNILLIAGHGDGDCGACGNGYQEANLTREVVALLADRLNGACNVTVADTSRNWFEYLGNHSHDFTGYDYVLEVHFNAGGGIGSEIYVTTSERGIGVESAIMAEMASLGFRNRGVKRYNYRVISRVKKQGVSASLLEVCFISSVSDMKRYQDKKSAVINAIAQGIIEGFDLKQSAVDEHWASKYYTKLNELGYIGDECWKMYDNPISVAHALALLDNISGGRWTSDESDASIHWSQPIIISLCGKGWITDKEQFVDLVKSNANMSNALCLALFDKATGGMRDTYACRSTDHWGRNCLDSLCDKAIITTPSAWTDFDGAVSYGRFMALICNAFKI